MNDKKILDAAADIQDRLTAFLADLIRIPSPSAGEAAVVARIAEEMRALDYDEVRVDGLGNVIGRIGDGPVVVAFDGHIDAVDVGNPDLWSFDPFDAHVRDGRLWGRGGTDQKGGFASAVYGAWLCRELGLLDEQVSLVVTGTVMEEDCDGLCWRYLIEQEGLRPDVAVLTEPTSLRVHRGQRGRMEMEVTVDGVSSHGSAPERGDNAVYKMARIVSRIERLNEELAEDDFLGKGTVVVSEIKSVSPSQCAVPDRCSIYIDRRLTWGETEEIAVSEIRACLEGVEGRVEVPVYERTSHTGLVYPMKKVFPVWKMEPDHPAVKAAEAAHLEAFGAPAVVDRWTFSTNGVTLRGVHGVPCVGFGPGHEAQAHAPDEWIELDHLWRAAAFYAAFPRQFVTQNNS